jgi:hypothetical protein
MGLSRGRRLELKKLVREFTVASRGPATITSIDLGRKRKAR